MNVTEIIDDEDTRAICAACNQQMLDGGSCTLTKVSIDDRLYSRFTKDSGEEDDCWIAVGGVAPSVVHETRTPLCDDCGIRTGGYHHPDCDMERCPKCGRQQISCGCWPDFEEA
jgi:hypothetical protein